MESFAPYPKRTWSEEDPEEELDVKPNHGVTVESIPFPTSRKGKIDSKQPEKDPEQKLCVETTRIFPVESFAPFLSCLVTKVIEDQKSFSDLSGDNHGCSNDKRRQLNVEALEPGTLQLDQLQKKFQYEGDAVRNFGGGIGFSKVTGNGTGSVSKEEFAGSSEKRRHSRWGPEQVCETGESDGTNKRKKTRWETDNETGKSDGTNKRRKTKWENEDELKILGPMHLPDFVKNFLEFECDPEVIKLKTKLMKINNKLQCSELQDDRPEEERSPSPRPVYNNLGIRINTREVRLREKLTAERADLISRLVKKNPTFKTPPKPKLTKLSKKLYVPVKEYPTYNFVGLIIGPRGNTQKKMEKETGAKIYLRGKGSQNSMKSGPPDNEDLHVRVEADNKKSLDAAVSMVEKLLIPVDDGINDHKRAQLAELARLNETCKDENTCNICKEQGHKEYACPCRNSTFTGISCDSCRSFCHQTSNCPLSLSSQMCEPSWNSSGLETVLTPNVANEPCKEIDVTDLYVGYLPQTIDSNRLKELFLPFGKITDAKVIKDLNTGLSKGYGFVTFENPTDAVGAVEYMNEYKMDGKTLAVRVAGQRAVADYRLLGNLSTSSGPTSSFSSSQSQESQAACLPLPAASLLPQSQLSVLNCEGLAFPPSLTSFGPGGTLSKSQAEVFSRPICSSIASAIPPSYKYHDQIPLASKIPRDVNYLNSMFHKQFHRPTAERSSTFQLNPKTDSEPRNSSWSAYHFA